jgi:alkylhydroperoxidase family enzyme
MGHSEMLLAVAGLDDNEIRRRTEALAGGVWSGFPPAEQIALALTYKLTKAPSEVTAQDIERLRATFGELRALDLIWHTAWSNYMTRVADAFQLPLEEENVFEEPPSPCRAQS